MRYQIEGGNLPAAVIQLDPGEKIVSELGGRTWAKDLYLRKLRRRVE